MSSSKKHRRYFPGHETYTVRERTYYSYRPCERPTGPLTKLSVEPASDLRGFVSYWQNADGVIYKYSAQGEDRVWQYKHWLLSTGQWTTDSRLAAEDLKRTTVGA